MEEKVNSTNLSSSLHTRGLHAHAHTYIHVHMNTHIHLSIQRIKLKKNLSIYYLAISCICGQYYSQRVGEMYPVHIYQRFPPSLAKYILHFLWQNLPYWLLTKLVCRYLVLESWTSLNGCWCVVDQNIKQVCKPLFLNVFFLIVNRWGCIDHRDVNINYHKVRKLVMI